MRKIIVSEMISADGFFADENGGIEWHVVEDEFNRYAVELLNHVDTILFGRVTYQMFESYWPAVAKGSPTVEDDLTIANRINEAKKIVFSKSMEKVGWSNVELRKEILAEEIVNLKQQLGKDIVIYGSGTVVTALAKLNLIDEYKLVVAPVILGKGKPLFKDLNKHIKLELTDSQVFGSGVVVLNYQPTNN